MPRQLSRGRIQLAFSEKCSEIRSLSGDGVELQTSLIASVLRGPSLFPKVHRQARLSSRPVSTARAGERLEATVAMASAADRFNINSQLEHLQSRYVGTGHADTNRFEWAVNIHRDSYASYVGRPTMLQYFAVAENESIGRVRYNMMQVRACEPLETRAFRVVASARAKGRFSPRLASDPDATLNPLKSRPPVP
jgi:splicing factor 3B subunit 5